MDFFFFAVLAGAGVVMLNAQDQRVRIRFLGQHLSQYQIERLMEALTDGYLRALGEANDERRAQIWQLLANTENLLCEQFNALASTLAQADPAQTRVSRLPLPLPLATRLLPTLCFDLRQALLIHAQGLSRVLRNTEQRSPRDKAFVMCAELFLMQHTCHWFCKSKTIASARLLARHQTSYDKVLASVSAPTRAAYLKLVGG